MDDVLRNVLPGKIESIGRDTDNDLATLSGSILTAGSKGSYRVTRNRVRAVSDRDADRLSEPDPN